MQPRELEKDRSHASSRAVDERDLPGPRACARSSRQSAVPPLTKMAAACSSMLKPGEVAFAGAPVLWCVRQTHLKNDGTQSSEWRYFVTSLPTVGLSAAHLLRLVHLQWAIENRHHWTLDRVFEEDARQPCLLSRSALEVTASRARLPLKDKLGLPLAQEC